MEAEFHRHCAVGCKDGAIDLRQLRPVGAIGILRAVVALDREAIIKEAAKRAL